MSNTWYRSLPNHKKISALGFGCSSVWASNKLDDLTCMEILQTCSASGINHFDTSPSYGLGRGEERLAQFLRQTDTKSVVLSTKVGSNLVKGAVSRGFDRDSIYRSFDNSMERLGVDAVDILYLHGPSEFDLSDQVFRFFEDQKAAKRITYSGVNSFDSAVLKRCEQMPIDAVMLQFNVGDFRLADNMKSLKMLNKIVISGTSLAQSKFDLMKFLPRDRKSLWYLLRMIRNEPNFIRSGIALGQRLAKIGGDPHKVAIQFVVSEMDILSNLFGTSSAAHARANALAGKHPLETEFRELLLAK